MKKRGIMGVFVLSMKIYLNTTQVQIMFLDEVM